LTGDKVASEDKAVMKDMESCIVMIHDWVVPLYELYIKCKRATDDSDKKNGICNGAQAIFEGGFCQYATLLETTCDTQEMCFSRDIKLMNEGDADVKVAEAARAADCEVGNKVKCYLKVFEEEDNKEKPKVLEKCKSLKFTCPDSIHFPPAPKPTTCTPEPHVPCDEPWLEKEYESKSWYAKAPTAPCHPCHLPHPILVKGAGYSDANGLYVATSAAQWENSNCRIYSEGHPWNWGWGIQCTGHHRYIAGMECNIKNTADPTTCTYKVRKDYGEDPVPTVGWAGYDIV